MEDRLLIWRFKRGSRDAPRPAAMAAFELSESLRKRIDTVQRVSKLPVHKGTATVELTTGQTGTIVMDSR